MATSPDAVASRLLLLLARALAVLTLLTVALLFVSAGVVVQEGSEPDLHGAGAITLHVVTGLLTIALVLRAHKARGGYLPPIVAGGLFVFTFVQAAMGDYATVVFHIPGALLVALASASVAAWTFQRE